MCSAQHCLKIINWFIDLSLIALGLGCYVQAFSSCGARGLLFVSVCGHLIEVASLVMERGLLAHRLQSVGSVVVMHGLRCSMACGIFLTRDGATVPCIGRRILNHQIMREAQSPAPRKYYFSFVHVCSVTSVMSNSLWPQGLYVAHQAPLFMEFSRQEYWSGSPFPSPGDLLNPGIKPGSPALQADSLPSEPPRLWTLLVNSTSNRVNVWCLTIGCITKIRVKCRLLGREHTESQDWQEWEPLPVLASSRWGWLPVLSRIAAHPTRAGVY